MLYTDIFIGYVTQLKLNCILVGLQWVTFPSQKQGENKVEYLGLQTQLSISRQDIAACQLITMQDNPSAHSR